MIHMYHIWIQLNPSSLEDENESRKDNNDDWDISDEALDQNSMDRITMDSIEDFNQSSAVWM